MVTILPALRQVREDLVRILDRSTVEQICHELGHRWRDRHLDPYTTLHLFILQVLNQNTAMTHLPHLSGEPFTPAAYCQARRRRPLRLFERLVAQFAGALGAAPMAGGGRDIRCGWKTARRSACRTHPSCRLTSASPVGRSRVADFPRLIFWLWSMLIRDSCVR